MNKLLLRARVKLDGLYSLMNSFDLTKYKYIDEVCFQLHQIVEFTLAYILENKINYNKTHDIRTLLNLASQGDGLSTTEQCLYRYADLLTQWYIQYTCAANFVASPDVVRNVYNLVKSFVEEIGKQFTTRKEYAMKIQTLPIYYIEKFEYINGIYCARTSVYTIHSSFYADWVIYTNPEMRFDELYMCTIMDVCSDNELAQSASALLRKGYTIGVIKPNGVDYFISVL